MRALYGASWTRTGDRDIMADELGHRRHSPSVPCFLGGDLHSWRELGEDVRHCRTVVIAACVYCGRDHTAKPRAPSAG
jgi:hypothetical protein